MTDELARRRDGISPSGAGVAVAFADGSRWSLWPTGRFASRILASLAQAMHLHRCEDPTSVQGQAVAVDDEGFPVALLTGNGWAAVKLPRHPLSGFSLAGGGETENDLLALGMTNTADGLVRLMERRGGLLVHGALAVWRGKGVILAAPGSGGKSTASRRLPDPWHSLCDDATLVARSSTGACMAHPWPTWSTFYCNGPGGTWRTTEHVPLAAVVFLRKSQQTTLTALGAGAAAAALAESAEQVTGPRPPGQPEELQRGARLMRFGAACEIASVVPSYALEFTRGSAFWGPLEHMLR